MKILSLYWGICSSASIYVDGKVVAAVHEERFTRIKNDDAFPQKSIDYCLEVAGITPAELDAVALASFVQQFDFTVLREATWSVQDYLEEQKLYWYPKIYKDEKLDKLEVFFQKLDLNAYPAEYWEKNYKRKDRNEQFLKDRPQIVADYLGMDVEKVRMIDHHKAHAYYSYYSSPFRGEKVLSFTVDAMGDGLNATIGIFSESGEFKRVYETSECNIGRIYRYMTLMLGMKPNEHEFKVMGLAPYGKEKYARKVYEIFAQTLDVDGIEFKWKVKPKDSFFWFKEQLDSVRFDNLAWGLQHWVEDLLVRWVRNAIDKFGISKIVLAGGVAMNIKAMGEIAKLPEVENLFVGGSASDESMAISSAICLAEDLNKEKGRNWVSSKMQPIENLYLGPEADRMEEKMSISQLDQRRYLIIAPSVDFIADCLQKGKILARCAGKMEFGQRALGNRSILANPDNLNVKEKINAAIKNRDFWMPFAPIILDSYAQRYLVNPKGAESPYMTIGFDTTKEGYEKMIAACHQADHSARPQILKKDSNSAVYEILEAFERRTGRGALLNTSFNLHGYPIVNSPEEAMDVFVQSDLDGLILNHYMIIKNK